jgi:hypothetical protein
VTVRPEPRHIHSGQLSANKLGLARQLEPKFGYVTGRVIWGAGVIKQVYKLIIILTVQGAKAVKPFDHKQGSV